MGSCSKQEPDVTFTEANLVKLNQAAEADERIKRGDHFSDWLALGIGLITLRDTAMRDANTNTPHGRGYTAIMGQMMRDHPWANRDKSTKSHAMWLADNAVAVVDWRETLGQNQREKLNHPSVVKRNFERMMTVKEPKVRAPDAKLTPLEQVRELQAQLADLTERNTELEGKSDGAGFDFRNDKPEDIKAIIDRLPHMRSLKDKVAKIITMLQAWHSIPARR